jgi:hypothetical protein
MDIKKIFLCDFSSFVLRDVALELKKSGKEIVYWTGCKSDFESFSKDKENFPNTIFHNIADAVRGVPASEMDTRKFEPPGADLISEMLECESTVLTMMTRMDFTNMPLAKKKALYYTYLQYWNGILTTLKPDIIIFSKTPAAVYNFAIACLAKKYNIPQIMFGTSRFVENFLLTDDYKKASDDLFDEYEKIKGERRCLEELGVLWQKNFNDILCSKNDAMPPYTKKWLFEMKKSIRILPSLKTIIKNIKSGTFARNGYYYFLTLFKNDKTKTVNNIDADDNNNYKGAPQLKKAKKIKEKFRQEYVELQSDINLKADNEKFIYIPFHYQPELTTCPLAGCFADQILMVKILSASVPADWTIYVRENIVQWSQRDSRAHLARYKGYYKQIAALKNVKLISPAIPTLDLISKSQAVATATGTAGWEALVKGKPVLYFGYPWYMYCDGAIKISDVKSCREAIQKIQEGYNPDFQKIINYAMAVERTAVKGTWEGFVSWCTLTPEETVKNLTKAIFRQFSKIENKVL